MIEYREKRKCPPMIETKEMWQAGIYRYSPHLLKV